MTFETQLDQQIRRNAAVLAANAETLTPLGQAIRDRCIGEMHRRFGKSVAKCDNERQEAAWWQEHFRQMWEGER